ncbi:MAG TPA: hypothetical protein VKR54_02830 [Candidatus Babeliales bacterium]|nr:hypothetical protein [Candidatus Babeliales bacterium]
MRINNKIIMSSLLGLVTTVSFAMEDKSNLEKSLSEKSLSSEELQSSSSYFIPIPSFSGAFEYVSNSLDSLTTTLTNKLSDKAAFQKLGWPFPDKIACQELQKSKEMYGRVNGFYKNKESYSGYFEDLCAVSRRYEYCQRVILALHNNTIANDSDRATLALHCLEHHETVMNSFDKAALKNAVPHIMFNQMVFRKLGWPLSDDIAQQELQKSKDIYKRCNTFLKNCSSEDYLDDCVAVDRIVYYCRQVLLAFYHKTITNHADRAELALHCLEHHGEILHSFDKATFLFFAKQDQQAIKQDTQKIDEGLANLTIIPDDNKLLDPLVDQTIQKREAQKKELEKQQQPKQEQPKKQ